jgi:D-3-phosphoglycerate dehydrogenase / 2-oxoglutarate reductase
VKAPRTHRNTADRSNIHGRKPLNPDPLEASTRPDPPPTPSQATMAAPPATTATTHHRALLPPTRTHAAATHSALRLPLRAHPHAHAQRARLTAAAAPAPAASTASLESSAAGKPTVLVAEKLGAAGLALLREFANVDCSYGLSPEDLRAKISLCDALIVRSGTKVGRDVFEASGGRLRVVGRAGVGIDNVDLAAATEHGCLVVNAPTANTVAAAEHGIALLTAMARNIAQADASLKAGLFPSVHRLHSESDACFCLGMVLP